MSKKTTIVNDAIVPCKLSIFDQLSTDFMTDKAMTKFDLLSGENLLNIEASLEKLKVLLTTEYKTALWYAGYARENIEVKFYTTNKIEINGVIAYDMSGISDEDMTEYMIMAKSEVMDSVSDWAILKDSTKAA